MLLGDITKAALDLEETFACGGCEPCAQPMQLVYKAQDTHKMVKSA